MKRLIGRHHIPPYLLLSQEDDHDVRDIGKHDFRSVLLHPMLSKANPSKLHHRFKREIRAVKAIKCPPDSKSQRGKNNDPKPNLTKENRHNTKHDVVKTSFSLKTVPTYLNNFVICSRSVSSGSDSRLSLYLSASNQN